MMKFTANIRTLFVLIATTCALLISLPVAAKSMQTIPGKSPSDQHTYAHITLNNGLSVILVSDPQAERPAASLAIKSGSYNDPDKHLGLAHLLEHMLFLGTEKYPEAGAYQEFIRKHGGTHNAYTSAQLTNYYFDTLPETYPEALDRFAQFFIAPTLDPAYIEREINAVDSEYRAKLDNEQRRSNQAIKTLFNPKHPGSRFTVGNIDTLGNIPASQLRELLIDFFERHYTPDKMVLTLTAKQPTETLAAYARTYFSDIQARHNSATLQLPELVQNNGKIQFFKTSTDKSVVRFSFQIPSQIAKYATQPARYLSYVLGDESKNSLFAHLKQHHWVQSLHAGIGQDDGQHALFNISMRLTDEGIAQRNKVIEYLLKTIDNIKNAPISEEYLSETKTLSLLHYRYHDYITPIKLSQTLSSRALDVGAENLLDSFHISKSADKKDIQALLKTLDISNLIIQWQHPSIFPEEWMGGDAYWLNEPLYNSDYANGDLSINQDKIIAKSALKKDFGLPTANLFMPDNLDLLEIQGAPLPEKIENKTGYDFWYKANTQYKKPTGMIFGYFGFLENPNTRDRLLLQLWAKLFNDAASESTYQPYMAGLGYQLYAHGNGLTLRTNGYNDKQADYFSSLVDQLMAFRASRDRLLIAKQDISKGLSNLESQPPYALARHNFSQVVIKGNAPTHVLKELLDSISINEVNQFINRHIQHFQYIGYMTGNFSKTDAHNLAIRVNQKVDNFLYKHPYRYVELKHFEAQERYLYTFNTRSNDNTVLYSLIATDNNNATYTERANVRILSQLLGARFYNEFRTEKQYGYIVAVTNQTIEKTPAIGFLVQSPNTSTEVLVTEIERFINETSWTDEDVSDKSFEQARKAVLAAYKKQPTSLKEVALEEWPHIVEPEHNFKDRQKWITALEQQTKTAFLEFINDKVEKDQAAHLLITNKWDTTEKGDWKPLSIE
ncbi:MAG: insulinase family protein [Marinomonas atlantica]|nr:insulinase family protein [Marinomonas atlantica]